MSVVISGISFMKTIVSSTGILGNFSCVFLIDLDSSYLV